MYFNTVRIEIDEEDYKDLRWQLSFVIILARGASLNGIIQIVSQQYGWL